MNEGKIGLAFLHRKKHKPYQLFTFCRELFKSLISLNETVKKFSFNYSTKTKFTIHNASILALSLSTLVTRLAGGKTVACGLVACSLGALEPLSLQGRDFQPLNDGDPIFLSHGLEVERFAAEAAALEQRHRVELKALRAFVLGPRTHGPMAPELPGTYGSESPTADGLAVEVAPPTAVRGGTGPDDRRVA